MTVLYRDGYVYSPADPRATAMLVDDGRVTWLGPGDEAPGADRIVDLGGALVTPAFVDAHVHTTNTGLALTGLDLNPVRSAAELLDAVAAHAKTLPADGVLLGFGWDESTWGDRRLPTIAELDRAAGERPALLAQASMHSALCSSALLAAAGPELAAEPGYDPSGWIRRGAHHRVRALALDSLTAAQRREVQGAALRHAASLGIVAIHECAGPVVSGEADLTGLLAVGGAGNGLPEVYGYWGELMGAARAKELGAVGAGGDLFADGALGARTAHLREPYVDADEPSGVGHAYLTADQVAEHIVDCARHGLQGGFHAIGDAAIGTVIEGYRAAATTIGVERLRAGRHRIEHVEIVDKAMIAGLVELGLVASMQPAFDRLWGGDRQMYVLRLGAARSLESNPFGAMHGVGVALAFGSDSPVTPMDPWGSVRAAMWHHNPTHRMSARAAFAAHTRGGWRAVNRDDDGVLVPGASATFAIWSRASGGPLGSLPPDGSGRVLPTLDPDDELPVCRRTVLRGTTLYEVA
jgi:predicted amidohydrolase YtcJ